MPPRRRSERFTVDMRGQELLFVEHDRVASRFLTQQFYEMSQKLGIQRECDEKKVVWLLYGLTIHVIEGLLIHLTTDLFSNFLKLSGRLGLEQHHECEIIAQRLWQPTH